MINLQLWAARCAPDKRFASHRARFVRKKAKAFRASALVAAVCEKRRAGRSISRTADQGWSAARLN